MPVDICVIVPTYNRAAQIPFTLDSILAQTHRPSEVIVVDDGSTDDTQTVVARYRERIKYIRVPNGGPPRARNIGIAASVAPWIAFCDSDDLWLPDKLATQARLLDRAPEVSFAFTNFRTIVNGEWSDTTKFDELSAGFWDIRRRTVDEDIFVVTEPLFSRLLSEQPVFPSTLLLSRNFVRQIGHWCEELGRVPSEDFEFVLRCAAHSNIGVSAAPLVGIRKHASNFSGDLVSTEVGEVRILDFVLEHHPMAKEYAAAIRDQIELRSAAVAHAAFSCGRFDVTRRMLQRVPLSRRGWKLQTKAFIAALPAPLAQCVRRFACA